MSNRLARVVIVASLSLTACGGKKGGTTTPPPSGGDDVAQPPPDNSGQMLSPETLDEIQRRFQRKAGAVSRCLSMVVDNKELPKNSRGRMTVEVQITKSGAAGDVHIIKASLDNKSLTECVVAKVKEIEFPAVPQSYPATYTYSFEAM